MAPEAKAQANKQAKQQRRFDHVPAANPGDDERTTISKKLSWILRHGAKRVEIKINDDGWIKVTDLLTWKLLEDVPLEKLMQVIKESNEQKPRYELIDSAEGQLIKAIRRERERKESESESVPRKDSDVVETEVKPKVEMRKDAPEFIPGQLGGYGFPSAMAPVQAAQFGYQPQNMMCYPWQYGGYGFPNTAVQGQQGVTNWPGAMASPPYGTTMATPGGAVAAGNGCYEGFSQGKGKGKGGKGNGCNGKGEKADKGEKGKKNDQETGKSENEKCEDNVGYVKDKEAPATSPLISSSEPTGGVAAADKPASSNVD
eukprot:TRINITY_DN43693_c0_g1_i1.p1 TRINITY_DN43693_c0_g1~~TRINITY_DN43693_c0_g1_i1.p1  ORF type:complete len:350 (-),score=65.98 TRINITY_DN43693_c0_g1_i1:331-1275(-)